MSEINIEKQIETKINTILQPILIIFENSKIDFNFYIAENLITFKKSKSHFPPIDNDQLNLNELSSFSTPLTNNSEQKHYAAVKLPSVDSEETGYFAIAKSDNSEFSKNDLALLNAFVRLINETIADFEQQAKLLNILNDFVHKSVHDLKNPLTSISLTSELLKRKTDDPATIMKFAGKLENASKRLFDNLDHLKSVFPVDDKSFKLNISQVDLNQLLKEAAAARFLEFVCTNEQTLIYADAGRLRHAFDCLITSAASNKGQLVVLETIDDQLIIKLPHHDLHRLQFTKFLMAKTLIGMHKGTINIIEDAYYISLPFETP
ncbi:sensor histidine kinase [Pedobacter sp.]